jgi:hypothetical protein
MLLNIVQLFKPDRYIQVSNHTSDYNGVPIAYASGGKVISIAIHYFHLLLSAA